MWSEDRLNTTTNPTTKTAAAPQANPTTSAVKDPTMTGFLQIDGLSQTYVPGNPVFSDVGFTLDKGEFVCIIGHSGCGKTTVLNVLAGLDTASSGHVFMDNREVAGPSLERGVVFQSHALMPWLTVRQNIAFAVKSRWPDWPAAKVNVHVEQFLALVGLLPRHRQKAFATLWRYEAARGHCPGVFYSAQDAAAG